MSYKVYASEAYVNEETSAKINELKASGGIGYEEFKRVEFLPETTLQFTYDEEASIMISVVPGVDENFFATSATVIWDGVTYHTKVLEGDNGFYFGNIGALEGNPTEEPFIVEVNVNEGYAMLAALVEGETHTVSISVESEVIKTLDPKYLPIIDLGEITDDDTELSKRVASQLEEAFSGGKPMLVRYSVLDHLARGSETFVEPLTFYDSSISPSTQKFVGPVRNLRMGTDSIADYEGIGLSGYYLEVTRAAAHTWVSRIRLIDSAVAIRLREPLDLAHVSCSYVSADGNTHTSDLSTVICLGIADTTKRTRIHVLSDTNLLTFFKRFRKLEAKYLYAMRLVLDNENAYSYAFSTFGSIRAAAYGETHTAEIPKTLGFSINVAQGNVSKRIEVTIVADIEDGYFKGAYVYIDCIVPEYTDYEPDAASI